MGVTVVERFKRDSMYGLSPPGPGVGGGGGGGGGGVLPYMGYIGMCRREGCGSVQAVYSRIGYINQRVWVQNRVSFFRKLISWLKILSRPGKQLL